VLEASMIGDLRARLASWMSQWRGSEPDPDGRFLAFISYRSADRSEAAWLQTALETYRLPGSLTTRLNRPARLGKVFRDVDELSASSNLGGQLQAALKRSDNLIVLCSPRAVAHSTWIDREIDDFISFRPADRIFAVLLEGEPKESFPPSLLRLSQVATRDIEQAIARPDEPLAADLRPAEGLSHSQVRRTALLRLVAGLLGIGFDDLRNRDAQRRSQRLRLLAAGAIVVLATVSGLGIWSEINRREAVAQRARAAHNQAEALARLGDDAMDKRQVLDAEFHYASSLAVQDQPQIREKLMQARSWGIRRVWEAPAAMGGSVVLAAPDGRSVIAGHSDQVIRIFDVATGRRLASLPGFTARISALALSPDGKRLAGGDEAGLILVFDTATGAIVERDDAGETTIVALAFDRSGVLWSLSADGRLVRAAESERSAKSVSTSRIGAAILEPDAGRAIAGDIAGVVRIIDTRTGAETATFKADTLPIRALAIDADGRRLATWGSDQGVRDRAGAPMRVRLWQLADHARLDELPDLGSPGGLGFAPDGAMLAIATGNGVVTWDIAGRQLATTPSQPSIKAVAFAPTGESVFAIGDAMTRLHGRPLQPVPWIAGHSNAILAAAFSADGGELVTAGLDGTVRIWDAARGVERQVITAAGRMSGIVYGVDGRTLIGCTFDGALVLLDRSSPAAAAKRVTSTATSTPQCGSFSTGNSRLAAISDGKVLLYSPDGEPLSLSGIEDRKAQAVAYSTDGMQLAVVDASGEVSLYGDGYAGLTDSVSLAPRVSGRPSVAWAPNGRMVAVAGGGLLLVWALSEPQRPVHQVVLPNDRYEIAFSADGQRIVAAGRELLVIDPLKGTMLARFNPYQVFQPRLGAVQINSGGTRVVIGGEGGLLSVYSLEDGPEAKALRPPDRTSGDYSFTPAVAFSPAQPLLATTSYDKSIRLWNLETGRAGDVIDGDYARVHGLCFTADGQHLMAGSEDGVIRTIDVATQTMESVRVVDGQPVHQLTASPGGVRLAFATRDSGDDIQAITSVVVWNRSTGKIEARRQSQSRRVLALAVQPRVPQVA
jgi:WD40 repeat protein